MPSANLPSMWRMVSLRKRSAVASSLKSKDGVSMSERPKLWYWPFPSKSMLISIDAVRRWAVCPLDPCTNLATEASWSFVVLDETTLVSSRRRRNEVLPIPSSTVKRSTRQRKRKGCREDGIELTSSTTSDEQSKLWPGAV